MRLCRERVDIPEILDRADLPKSEIVASLHDLELVNTYLGGMRSVVAHVLPVLQRSAGQSVTMLDIACGGGDVLRAIARQARRLNVEFRGIGADINPVVLEYAASHSQGYPELSWQQADAFQLPFPSRSIDVVACSTFLHHLDREEGVRLLRSMKETAKQRLILADLFRSAVCYVSFRILARIACFNPVSRHDGAASLRRAYLPSELAEMAQAAGIQNFQIHKNLFCRMTIVHDVTD